MKITLLSAGTGGRKLLAGFAQLVGHRSMTVIANTGDDFIHLGLHISPDIDSILYQLSGLLDEGRGWGRSGETFSFLEEVRRLGGETWFRLGDKDLAMHVLRTSLLGRGLSLTDVTKRLAAGLGVASTVLPMSDDRVQTRIVTDIGTMTFNEYLVRDRALPRVKHVFYDGSEVARPAPGVIQAVVDADLIVIGPSSPLAGIGPIISIQPIREALRRFRDKVVAVSPIIGGGAVSGPSGQFMKAEGVEVSVRGVARLYSDIASRIFVHHADSKYIGEGPESQPRLIAADILMKDVGDSMRLANEIVLKCEQEP